MRELEDDFYLFPDVQKKICHEVSYGWIDECGCDNHCEGCDYHVGNILDFIDRFEENVELALTYLKELRVENKAANKGME